MKRRIAMKSLSTIGIATLGAFRGAFGQQATGQDHVAWVASVLEKMQTIKIGMSRKDLLIAFTTKAGLSTALHRTFVSRDCSYFNVDVEFAAVGRPNRDIDGRETLIEDARDVIVKMSEPYLEFSIMD